MGSTDNAAAGTAAKVSSNSSSNSGFGNSAGGEFDTSSSSSSSSSGFSGLSGSVGIGGANAPDDVFQVSSALTSNGLMQAPQNSADSTLYSGIISAQEGMDSSLKRDGLVNPGGPTQQTYNKLNDQGFVKAPALPPLPEGEGRGEGVKAPGTTPGTGDAAANAAITAQTKQQAVKTAEAKSRQHMGDVTRTGFQQIQDVKRVQKAKTDAKRAEQRAQELEANRREKDQQAKLKVAGQTRTEAQKQAAQQTRKLGQEIGTRIGETLRSVLTSNNPSPRHSGAGRNPERNTEGLSPRIRGDDALNKSGVHENPSPGAAHPPLPREREATTLPPLPEGEGRGEGPLVRPHLSDDAFQSNQRLAESLKKRRGVGDLPTFTTDAINTGGVKAVSEVADLIDQVHEHDPEQAQELFDKTMQGIGNGERRSLEEQIRTKEYDPERDGTGRIRTLPANPVNGEPEIKPMGQKNDAGSGSDESLQGVTMDENGRYYDKEGNRIENPDKNPNLKKAQFVPVAPAPGLMPPPSGTIQPATPQDVQKALDRAQGDLEKLANDPAFLKTAVGQAMITQGLFRDLISEGDARPRTDAAPKLPDREEFPAQEGEPNDGILPGRSTEHDRVIDPPPYEIPETGQFDIPPSENQTDDLPQGTILNQDIASDWKAKNADGFWKGHEKWMETEGKAIEARRAKNPIAGKIQKAESYIWKNLERGDRPKQKKDSKGNIYEWDFGGNMRHGTEIEKYNKRGKHLGSFDPLSGKRTGNPDNTKDIKTSAIEDGEKFA